MAKKKHKIPTPRNPFTLHLVRRQGDGAHGQTFKARRRDEKMKLKSGKLDLSDCF